MEDITPGLMEMFVDWTDPVPRQTRENGVMYFRQSRSELDKDFWQLWRDHKEDIKALGIGVRRDDESGEFRATWWSETMRQCSDPVVVKPADTVLRREFNVPGFEKLRPYQRPAAGTLLEVFKHHRGAIDSSDVGLGKTWTAAAVAYALGINVAVICPAKVITKWTDTLIDGFGIEPEFVLSYNKVRGGRFNEYITRTDKKRGSKTTTTYEWNTCDKVLLIFDEVHECSASDSLNSKVLRAAILNQDIYVLGLSATIANTVLTMDVIGQMLGLHWGQNFWDWCMKHGARPGLYGGLDFNSKWPKAQQGLAAIHGQIYPHRGVRLLRSELKDQLPKNDIIVEVIDPPELPGQIIEAELARVDELEQEDYDKAAEKGQAISSLIINTRDRQRSELLKVSSMVDKTNELLETGRSVVVFLNFTQSIRAFKKMIHRDIWYRELVGGLGKKVDEVIKDFQTNKVRLLIVQTDAGSESIDLHDLDGNFPRATVISPGYSARKLIQTLGRVDRNGAMSDCVQFIVFTTHAVEKRAANLVQSKLDNLALLNDGDIDRALKVV